MNYGDVSEFVRVWIDSFQEQDCSESLYRFDGDDYYTDITTGIAYLKEDIVRFIENNINKYQVTNLVNIGILYDANWPDTIIIKSLN